MLMIWHMVVCTINAADCSKKRGKKKERGWGWVGRGKTKKEILDKDISRHSHQSRQERSKRFNCTEILPCSCTRDGTNLKGLAADCWTPMQCHTCGEWSVHTNHLALSQCFASYPCWTCHVPTSHTSHHKASRSTCLRSGYFFWRKKKKNHDWLI